MKHLVVDFHKMREHNLVMQVVHMDERLRDGDSVEYDGHRVSSQWRPQIRGNCIYLRGTCRDDDFYCCSIKFDSDEAMEEWLRGARKALEKYVQLNIPEAPKIQKGNVVTIEI